MTDDQDPQRCRDRIIAAIAPLMRAGLLTRAGLEDAFKTLDAAGPYGWTRTADAMPPWDEGESWDGIWRETLPVLATDGKCIEVAYYRQNVDPDDCEEGRWQIDGPDGYSFEPTHWRPLPPLPKD